MNRKYRKPTTDTTNRIFHRTSITIIVYHIALHSKERQPDAAGRNKLSEVFTKGMLVGFKLAADHILGSLRYF